MNIQIIANQLDLFGIWTIFFKDDTDFVCPIDFCRISATQPLANRNTTPAAKWFGNHENVGDSRSFVFIIDPSRMIACCRNRLSNFLEQLHRLFVHHNDGNLRIMRQMIGFERVFHHRNILAALFGKGT
jgi:hypothetical protein